MRGSGGGGGGGGGGGEKVWTPSKISRYMGKSRSKPTPAPEEISWFRALGLGGGGQFISLECINLNRLPNEGPGSGGGG